MFTFNSGIVFKKLPQSLLNLKAFIPQALIKSSSQDAKCYFNFLL